MQSLDSEVVSRLFGRLVTRYGSAWHAKWGVVDVADLRKDWARELAGIPLDAIAYAIDNLPPEFPPTVTQFRVICLRAPNETPRLAAPEGRRDPARVAAMIGRLQEAQGRRKPLQWAIDLKAREQSGEQLSPSQRHGWREALKTYEERQPLVGGVFTPIPDHILPPGMRQGKSGQSA